MCREKSHEIVKIFNDPLCPQSISIAAFVKKVIQVFTEMHFFFFFTLIHFFGLVHSEDGEERWKFLDHAY